MALSGGFRMSALTPLLEVERTFVGRAENAAFDPDAALGRVEIPHCGKSLT
jgi:hypothetical protein